MDRHVRPSSELVVRGKPRRERRVRQDELALRQRLPQRLSERRHPLLRSPVPPVHRTQVLVVHVDPVQPVRLHERCHRVRRTGGVRVRRRGGVCRAERGRDDADAGLGVLGLLCGLCVCGEGSPVACLVYCAVEGEE